MRRQFILKSGRVCTLDDPGLPFLPGYHVLYFPGNQGVPTASEMEEMAGLAWRAAREVGQAVLGDPECYTVLYIGARARRRPWVHFHLLPVESVQRKRWALLCLVVKRWTRMGARALGERGPVHARRLG